MSRKNVLFLVGLAVISAATVAYADEPFKKYDDITPDDWAVGPDSSRGIFDAVVLFEKVVDDDHKLNDEKCYRYLYRRIRILSESGRSWGDVTVPTLHTDQKVERLRGRTVLPDGSTYPVVEDQVFKKKTVKSKGVDIEEITFSIPNVTSNCIVEYVIKIRTPEEVNDWIFQQDIPVLKAEKRWIFVKYREQGLAYQLLAASMGAAGQFDTPNFIWLNAGANRSMKQYPNIKEPEELRFSVTDVPPFEDEPWMPPEASLKGKLVCYYGTEGSPAAYWGSIAQVLDKYFEHFCKDDDKVRDVVKQFEGLDTDSARIYAAYHWLTDSVDNLSYDRPVAVNEDEGGKDDKKKDKRKELSDIDDVNDVIKHHSGGRQQINMTFWDMLREMNIDAKLLVLKDRWDDLFVQEAKYYQFDADAVAVETDGGYYVYAPGTLNIPFRQLPWFYEGVLALVVGGQRSFVALPFSPPSQNRQIFSHEYTLGDDLRLSGTARCRLTGDEARSIRMYLYNLTGSDRLEKLRQELEDRYPSAEVESPEFTMLEEFEAPLDVSCQLVQPPLVEQAGRIFIKPSDFLTEVENPFVSPDRQWSILFENAVEVRENASLIVPDGWEVEALPADTIYRNEVGACGLQYSQAGGMIMVSRAFTLESPFWAAEHYAAVRTLFEGYAALDNSLIVLARSAGEPTGAVTEP